MVELIRSGLPRLSDTVVDAAWQAKWGVTSAGTEEAARIAARQNVVGAAVEAIGAAASAEA